MAKKSNQSDEYHLTRSGVPREELKKLLLRFLALPEPPAGMTLDELSERLRNTVDEMSPEEKRQARANLDRKKPFRN
jgi:hypothetical protein